MAIEDTIMGWMKNLGEIIIPGEGGEKVDLFEPYTLPPSLLKAETVSETFEQVGGEFQMDEGDIEVFTDTLEVIEFNEDVTEVTDILSKDLLEAHGTTGSGGIIDSFLEKYATSESGKTEIKLSGKTTDGENYDFTLGAFPDNTGEVKYYIWSDGEKAELELDQFVTLANNLDEKMGSVESVRKGQDRWSPQSFRYAWEQIPKVTVGEPYSPF